MARVRAKIGDIVEVPTPRGLCFAQLTHQHPEFGQLLAFFEGFDQKRPALAAIVERPLRFQTFFPLAASLGDGFCSIAGWVEVPEQLRPFPLFRSLGLNHRKDAADWWLWDGELEWKVGDLDSVGRRLPIRMIPGQPLLVERLVSDWRPETDDR